MRKFGVVVDALDGEGFGVDGEIVRVFQLAHTLYIIMDYAIESLDVDADQTKWLNEVRIAICRITSNNQFSYLIHCLICELLMLSFIKYQSKLHWNSSNNLD